MVHNLYIPAGGDIADPVANPKFAHKLAFLDEMHGWFAGGFPGLDRAILVGDLNVAPLEQDVWSHKQLLDVVSHTPVETEAMKRMMATGGWIDVMRRFVPEPEKLYTWWSYRAADWVAANRGRRLDHVWASAVAGTGGARHERPARSAGLAAAVRPCTGERRLRSQRSRPEPHGRAAGSSSSDRAVNESATNHPPPWVAGPFRRDQPASPGQFGLGQEPMAA